MFHGADSTRAEWSLEQRRDQELFMSELETAVLHGAAGTFSRSTLRPSRRQS
jgi:hypothetical protein